MAVRMSGAGAGGALARQAAARGAAAALAPGLGVAEGSREAAKLGRGHAGEAAEGTGIGGERLGGKRRATSALPDRVGRSCSGGYCATTLMFPQPAAGR